MYHTQAIILKKEEWREADWLVTALTEDFGKLRLLAQGARKHGAKLQGHIEPGSHSAISFVSGRNGYRLTTACLVEHFSAVFRSLSKSRAVASTLAALDANLWEEGDRAEELFRLTRETLALINTAERVTTLRRVIVWFSARLLDLLGVLPARDSREAEHAGTVFDLIIRPPSDLDLVRLREDTMEQEFSRLLGRIGYGIVIPTAVIAVDSAIYPVEEF